LIVYIIAVLCYFLFVFVFFELNVSSALTIARGEFWLDVRATALSFTPPVVVLFHTAPPISHNGRPPSRPSWDMFMRVWDMAAGTPGWW
jgi:hypothetical protein